MQCQPMRGSHPNANSVLKLQSWLCLWWGWEQGGFICSFQQRAVLDLLLFLFYVEQKWLATYFSCLLRVSNWGRRTEEGMLMISIFSSTEKEINVISGQSGIIRGLQPWFFVLSSCRYTAYLMKKPKGFGTPFLTIIETDMVN